MSEAIVGLVIALAVAMGYGYLEHQKVLVAEANLTTCTTELGAQNKSVKTTADDGIRRMTNAAKGIEASTAATKSVAAEAERLRALNEAVMPTPAECPAGAAIAQIRKGLR